MEPLCRRSSTTTSVDDRGALKISHEGRVRLSELEQQLRSGRDRDETGLLWAKRHLTTDLAIAVLSASQKAPLSVAFADGARPAHRRRGGRSSRGAPRRPSGQGRRDGHCAQPRDVEGAGDVRHELRVGPPSTSSPRRRPARSMAAGGRSGASATAAARRAGQSRCCSRHAPLVGAGTAGILSAQLGDGRIGGANGPAELKKLQILQVRLGTQSPSGPPNALKNCADPLG